MIFDKETWGILKPVAGIIALGVFWWWWQQPETVAAAVVPIELSDPHCVTSGDLSACTNRQIKDALIRSLLAD